MKAVNTLRRAIALAALTWAAVPAQAQNTIKIGEINSYKAQPAFLEPYKKGMELAIDEINAAGGFMGKKSSPATTTPTRAMRCGWPKS